MAWVFVSFAKELLPTDVVSLTAAAVLLLFGILDTDQVASVFANQAVITVACMFVLSAALERTGVIDSMGNWATQLVGRTKFLALFAITTIAIILSAIINNTPVVVILTPVAIRLCKHLKIAPSKLLIPLSYAAIMGGTCTLIGTSTNILVDGVARELGQTPFTMFEITAFGACMAVVGMTYLMLIGFRLLPERQSMDSLLSDLPSKQFLTEIIVPRGSELIGKTIEESKIDKLADDTKIIDVIRSDESMRRHLDELIIQSGDRILIKTAVEGLIGLRERGEEVTFDPEAELQEVGSRATTVVEAVIGPRSRFVEHRLMEFNLRKRYGVYIIAVHRQGVNLRDKFERVRLEIGDTLLLEGPEEGIKQLVEAGDLINLTMPSGSPTRRDKAPRAIGAVASVVLFAALDIMPIAGIALIASVFCVLSGCLTRDEAYEAVEWRLLFLILGMLTLGLGMAETKTVDIVAAGLVSVGDFSAVLFGAAAVPMIMLMLVYLISSLLTEMMSNNAVGVLVTPVAITLALQLDVDPRPFIVAVMFAASCSFATPIGYQTNTFVYGAGGYKYTDFLKVGGPLNIIYWLVATQLIPFFWPF